MLSKTLTPFASIVAVAVFQLGMAASASAVNLRQDVNFFENALRRDATKAEAAGIVRTKSGCAGFFVANAEDRLLVASARHCFQYDIEKSCHKGLEVMTAAGSHSLICSRVVAARSETDMAIIEVMPTQAEEEEIRRDIRFFTLSSVKPQDGQALKMVGYPADPERNGRLTTTLNCSANSLATFSQEALTPEESRSLSDFIAKTTNAKLSAANAKVQTFRGALHNCSVYGGNSGGPMFYSGQRIVFGLPSTYLPFNFRRFASHYGAFMETTADFIRWNAKAIRANRIIVVNPYEI